MNFLLRQSQAAAAASTPPPGPPSSSASSASAASLFRTPSKGVTTLEGLIAAGEKSPSLDSSFSSIVKNHNAGGGNSGSNKDSLCGENGNNLIMNGSISSQNLTPLPDKHVDVNEDQGWITIPFKELPDDWDVAPDINEFQSLDRPFVFPGEQVHILACLSASKQDSEIITPFKVAAMMNKNGSRRGAKDQNGDVLDPKSVSGSQPVEVNDHIDAKSMSRQPADVSASESFLRMEDHKKQTQTLLQRFKDSHFFVRMAESGEPLWSKKGTRESSETVSDTESMEDETAEETGTSISTVIDSARFDARASGGVARNSVKCCSLANGDIVVLLQVNVGVDSFKDPILEILQFEKHYDRITGSESDVPMKEEQGQCGDLLKWLLPLDNTSQYPANRPLSPPLLNISHKTSFSASSSSQLLSHFRSYSMSSIPQNSGPAASPSVSAGSSKANFDLEDWDRYVSQKSAKSPRSGSQGLLSFRGVPLEPERFSVCCGLEGIYIPGRRWRKRLEIIQPVDIYTYAADCNTDDLLCVKIKNVSPARFPDIVVYIDAITIILEEASKGGPPLSVPVACIEAGTDHSLPNLALRRGEEHSFILKPATSVLKKSKIHSDKVSQFRSKAGSKASSMRLPLKAVEASRIISSSDKYAVLVSCRCNYSESRLFFKKPTDWRPRISRDFMISVATEISKQTLDLSGKVSQLPVQVLTLQASNLTAEDLTLTILAPASFTSPPSAVPVADFIPSTALSCTHLWLHSRVPLGRVPSQSTDTIKLELLPLTDGIITLDTLQIYVKEKGVTYIPEHALKINATSSIATGII